MQVLKHESEWTVTYTEVLDYLKESYLKMVTNLRYPKLLLIHWTQRFIRCCGLKIAPVEGAEKGDISAEVQTLVTYLQNMEVAFLLAKGRCQ